MKLAGYDVNASLFEKKGLRPSVARRVTSESGLDVSIRTMRHFLTVDDCLLRVKQNDLVLAKDTPKYLGVNENHHSSSDGPGKTVPTRRKMSNSGNDKPNGVT